MLPVFGPERLGLATEWIEMLDQDGLKVTAMVSVLRPSGLKYGRDIRNMQHESLGLATEWIEIIQQ